MRKLYSAILSKDVSYFDFEGAKLVCPAGSVVSIFQVVSHDGLVIEMDGSTSGLPVNNYIASKDGINFDIDINSFAVEN